MNNQSITIEEITDSSAFEALLPEWSELWERCPSATPFQSPEWLLTWWKHFGNDNLFALALRNGKRLAGLAPLFIFRQRDSGALQLSMVGSGISDYLDFLMEPGIASTGTQAVFEYLAARKPKWDVCDLQELRRESTLLAAVAASGLRAEISAMEVCPTLVLPASVETFRAGLSARFRKRLRHIAKGLEKAGGFSTGHADGKTLTKFLNALFRLHSAAWEERNHTGVLADAAVKAFHREVAARFLERGWLRLRALRLGGSIIAVLYSFAAKGRLYSYLSGFDPVAAEFSPGKFILWLAIEDAIREGIREFDFLRGNEEYKYLWGPEDRINYRLQIRHAITRQSYCYSGR